MVSGRPTSASTATIGRNERFRPPSHPVHQTMPITHAHPHPRLRGPGHRGLPCSASDAPRATRGPAPPGAFRARRHPRHAPLGPAHRATCSAAPTPPAAQASESSHGQRHPAPSRPTPLRRPHPAARAIGASRAHRARAAAPQGHPRPAPMGPGNPRQPRPRTRGTRPSPGSGTFPPVPRAPPAGPSAAWAQRNDLGDFPFSGREVDVFGV
jgi:hypothetical protein